MEKFDPYQYSKPEPEAFDPYAHGATLADERNLDYYTGAHRGVIDQLRDVAAGVVGGLGRGGQFIASEATGGYAPTVDFNALQEKIASPNKSMWGNVLQGTGQSLPYLYAGGASLPGLLSSGAVSGTVNSEPGQKNLFGWLPNGRFGSAIENALINGLFHFGSKLMPESAAPPVDSRFKQKFTSPSSKSEFTNVPFQPPSFLNESQAQPLSPAIANELNENITGGRSFEDSGKQLAKEINENYNGIKNSHQAKYNDLFDSPTDKISIFNNEPIKVKDTHIENGEYENAYNDYKFPDKNIDNLHKKFIENKNIQNAHKLQSELGSEIGYLKKQKNAGSLDDSGKNKLSDYASMRETLKNDIDSQLGEIDPKLSEEYANATKAWEKNVIPYHSDKDLKDIAEGRIKNPTQSSIVSIFKNPEENIQKVSSDLSDNGRDKIIHLGMGKNAYQNTPKDMMQGASNIENKGLGSYLHPTHDQLIKNLRNNIEMENQAKLVSDKNQEFVNNLRSVYEKANQDSAAQSINSLKQYQAAENEAKRIAGEKLNELLVPPVKSQFIKNALTSLGGAAAGAGIMHFLNSPELLGGYLGSKLGKEFKNQIKKKIVKK